MKQEKLNNELLKRKSKNYRDLKIKQKNKGILLEVLNFNNRNMFNQNHNQLNRKNH